jgi:hypothetical protein
MSSFWQRHGLTTVALVMAGFMLFIAIASALDVDSDGNRVVGGVTFGVLGLALLCGLWLLREGRATGVAYASIVVPAVLVGVGLFWMLFIPTIMAFVVILFGVVRGGLVRELRPSDGSSPPLAA